MGHLFTLQASQMIGCSLRTNWCYLSILHSTEKQKLKQIIQKQQCKIDQHFPSLLKSLSFLQTFFFFGRYNSESHLVNPNFIALGLMTSQAYLIHVAQNHKRTIFTQSNTLFRPPIRSGIWYRKTTQKKREQE